VASRAPRRRALAVSLLVAGGAMIAGVVGGDRAWDATADGPGTAREAGMDRLELTGGGVVVGVVPPLGGRVVVLRSRDGENLLDADPKHWSPPFPEPGLDTPFRPWNGRIVWAGPQSGFWSQQRLRPELRESGAGWPPDPFNETGRFEVVERTPTRLSLRGAVSPVTGLSLAHEYEIVGERTVRMKATATNGRDTKVAWDLWPNTRVRPEGFPYVPLRADDAPRVDGPETEGRPVGRYPHEVRDGWLALPPGHRPRPRQEKLWAKAFVRPARGLIACFLGRHILVVRADVVPPERLHPEQAFVEIYRGAGRTDAEDILELEMHGPYETLAPGKSMSFEQTFEILQYDGAHVVEAHLARLAEIDL